ncbi:MAG: protein-L-isoaspartate O-methyltransferase [Spirochaetes bacterium]|nr:protein-L-isoaspartate O-methyltransferase [Spirochaetota bacterium]
MIKLFSDSFSFNNSIKKKVEEAFFYIDRADFVHPELKKEAYINNALPTYCGQTISQPQIVYEMTCLLNPEKDDKILEIGTGVGYQTAILAYLSKEIITIERHKKLHLIAQKNLSKYNFKNIKFLLLNGAYGYEEEKPYNKIIITASIGESNLKKIKEQLSNNGILVAPIQITYGLQKLIKITKIESKYIEEDFSYCIFVPIVDKDPE